MAQFTSKELSVILTSVSSVSNEFHFVQLFPYMLAFEELDGNSNYSISITKSEHDYHVYGLYPSGKVISKLADKYTLSIAIKTIITKVLHNCN